MVSRVPSYSTDRLHREQTRQGDEIAALREQVHGQSGVVGASASQAYVDGKIAALIDTAPGALDTLNELAAALGDDANFAATVTASLAGKEPTIAAGTAAQYWRGDKSWGDLAAGVRAVVLTGLSLASAVAVAATDSVLAAIGKLQAQISALPLTASGTYTPTFTKVANADATTAYVWQWLRVGSTVTVSGRVDVDPTLAASTVTQVGISLPVASNLGASTDCIGVATVGQSPYIPAAVSGDAVNDRATLVFYSGITTSVPCFVQFTYTVLP